MVPCGLINRYVEQWPFSAIKAGKRVGEVRIKKMEYTKTCEIIQNPQISLSNLCYLPRIICIYIYIVDSENLLSDSPSQNHRNRGIEAFGFKRCQWDWCHRSSLRVGLMTMPCCPAIVKWLEVGLNIFFDSSQSVNKPLKIGWGGQDTDYIHSPNSNATKHLKFVQRWSYSSSEATAKSEPWHR